MEENYEFNAPMQYYDIANGEYEDDPDSYFATSTENQKCYIEEDNIDLQVTERPKEALKELSYEHKYTPKKKSSNLQKTLQLDLNSNGLPAEFPVRHSPRLATLSKAIRKSNANRGIVDSTLPKNERNHRRSLSEGSIATKVHKTQIKRNTSIKVSKKDSNPSVNHINSKLSKTKPMEFNFATNSHVKNKEIQDIEEYTAEDFVRSLRSNSSTNINKQTKGPTKVKPFKFHSQEKLDEHKTKQFVSLAELNMKFYMQTPPRFRSKRNTSTHIEQPIVKKGKGATGLTIPHTPQLLCQTRSRPIVYPTREEEEEQQLQEALKHKFKANPVDKKIYDHSPVKVADKKKSMAPQTKELPKIKSNLKELDSASLLSLPHSGVPRYWKKASTQVKPFSFDARDAEVQKKKEERIQMLIDQEKERRAFQAQSDSVLFKAPFIPEKSKKPLTDISGFSLNTEKRAQDRHGFDLLIKQKEDEMQAMKNELEERRQREEEEEVAKLRKEMVPRAQPIRKAKPMVIKHGLIPVTNPVSPEFLTESRLSKRTTSKMSINCTVDELNSDAT